MIRELRGIKATRDHIAHQGLALTLEEQTDETFLVQKTKELEEAHGKAAACFKKLLAEMEATDEAVNRAYKQLQVECGAEKRQVPEPFDNQTTDPARHEQ